MSCCFDLFRPALRVLSGMTLLLAVVSAQALDPVPHAAQYELSLHPDSRGGEVAAVKGRLEVRLERSCDGWATEQSLGFRMMTRDGETLEHVAQLSSFEERDGSAFVFNTRTWEDRALVERLSGVASRGAGRAEVRYSLPQAAADPLPDATVFPVRHLSELLGAAVAGERMLMRTVFDGSTSDNPYDVSGWIGTALPPSDVAPGPLAGRAAWPVRLAYFPVDAIEPSADFEMSVVLYDNGIAGDMIYDYGDFAIDVRLVAVEALPSPTCP